MGFNRFKYLVKKDENGEPKKLSKKKNVRCECDGYHFSSKKEMEYYKEFKLLEQAGKITNLLLQPEFLLLEGFRDKTGYKHISIKYIADFKYTEVETGLEWIIDVKASKNFLDSVYKIKKKMFLHKYPESNFREVY